MTELVVALGAGTLLITGTGVALQSTQNMVVQEENKLSLRQNTVNGLRLMRSEIERSMQVSGLVSALLPGGVMAKLEASTAT